MAKEVAISKRLKISEAQKYMLASVIGASAFFGIAISLVSHFIGQISYNTQVIMAEEETIVGYSDFIKNAGVCKAPKGSVYTDDEIKKCDPSSIEASEVSGTLRANVLESLASNEALGSVPKEDNGSCINPSTSKTYTYKELKQNYDNAKGSEGLQAASQLIRSCSALRVIPDALPAFKNEEALLASLNKLFIISGWEPESISPSGSTSTDADIDGLNTISVNLSVEANSGTATTVLSNIEHSIREFDIKTATIEWGGNDALMLRANATAYYMDESHFSEITKTIKEGK